MGTNYYPLEKQFRNLSSDKRALVYIKEDKITIEYGLTEGLLIYDSESIIYTEDSEFLNKSYIKHQLIEDNWYYTMWD